MRESNGGNWAGIQQIGFPVFLIHGESCLQLLGKGVSISALECRVPLAKSSWRTPIPSPSQLEHSQGHQVLQRGMQDHRESPGGWSPRCRKLPRFVDWKQDWKELHCSHKAYGFCGFLVHAYKYLNTCWTGPNLTLPRQSNKGKSRKGTSCTSSQCKIASGPMIMCMDFACNGCIQLHQKRSPFQTLLICWHIHYHCKKQYPF